MRNESEIRQTTTTAAPVVPKANNNAAVYFCEFFCIVHNKIYIYNVFGYNFYI